MKAEGPAGDYDYGEAAQTYRHMRRPDSRIANRIWSAIGPARTIVNVGAGTGSYGPADRYVIAVEPSAAMRAQRPPHLPPALDAVAEDLPFDDTAFDAGMAIATVHQWRDPTQGIYELRRVCRGPVVILSFDPDHLNRFWLAEYAPGLIEIERRRYPPIESIRAGLGESAWVEVVPIAFDCTDGFTEAFFARPERFLDPEVRRAQSAWSFVDSHAIAAGMTRLDRDLRDGTWDGRYGQLRNQAFFEGSARLIISDPATDHKGRRR